jgi:hypothetical protein
MSIPDEIAMDEAIQLVRAERHRQEDKWGPQYHDSLLSIMP